MNKIGIYYAYWTHDWDADFVPFVSKVKQLGFDILEVNSGTVTKMSNSERDRLKTEAHKQGIELTYCIGLPHEYDIASEDSSVRRAGIAFLKKSAEAVKYMGSKQLGGIIYSSWPGKLPGNKDKRAFVDRSVESMREVIKVVEDCEVFFNVEVVNRFEQYIMNTSAEAVEYVERVGSDHCKVLLDSFHLNIEEDDIHAAIVTAGDRLGHFHIGETNRRAPGRGRMPWNEIFAAIKQIGYQGAISMEPFLMPGGEVGRDISVYRDLRDGLDLDEEAGRALKFVRQEIEQA
ncbi:D-psicose 3-epimerase [Bythopirellula polymerisocia]|uniref:D-tagatose 3-epimerase n=1 Tax=Bythopirellula polymerisocia TaxID=2528003 RepID=A0A5C6C9W5_9BACT|nr:sugar phosphate isomerase/epimerase [Bythopirellula polymerisocia]TWU21380.1 D-tagatose 3-epimerase [Bythopirellula polymerisocia]